MEIFLSDAFYYDPVRKMALSKPSDSEHRVAVYGSLKAGLHNHRYLQGARFIGRFRTAPEFTMVDLGPYPGILPHGRTAIEVEVYGVDRKTLRKLDALEEHPICYRRTRIRIQNMDVDIYVLTEHGLRDHPRGPVRIIRSGRW